MPHAASPSASAAPAVQRSGPLLALILASYAMIVIDISIVITALPQIRDGLGFSATGLAWVHNAYTLALGGLLLLGARAGDVLGRRRVFMAGLALFTVASLAVGAAPSAAWLVTARALQGAGAALLAPSTLALLATHFAEGPARTRALGLYGATAGIASSVGLVLGGVIADLSSWRVGFFINLPIGALLLWVAHRHVAESPRRAGALDLPGAITSTLGMLALVYGLIHAADATDMGWFAPITLAALVAAGGLLLVFFLHEARAAQPLLPLHLLASRERAGALAARLLFLGGMIGFWFYTTQYLQGVLGLRPLQAGLAFLPATVVNFAVALAVPRLSRRFGHARLLAAGLGLCVLGMAWLAQLTAHTPYWLGVALPMLLIGAGQGAALSPLTVAAVSGVAPQDAGAASGLVNVAHQLGSALGLSLLVVVFADTPAAAGADAGADLAHRVARALSAGALLLAFSLVVVWLFVVRRRTEGHPGPVPHATPHAAPSGR
jgi:EmrB/QacA subfamily drug resistance transporter